MRGKMYTRHESVNSQHCRSGNKYWSVARLIQLSKELEVFEVAINGMSLSYSYSGMSLKELTGHVEAVNSANLDYPIILDDEGDIMDGRHRLMKCLIEGHTHIKAVRFSENPPPCEVK